MADGRLGKILVRYRVSPTTQRRAENHWQRQLIPELFGDVVGVSIRLGLQIGIGRLHPFGVAVTDGDKQTFARSARYESEDEKKETDAGRGGPVALKPPAALRRLELPPRRFSGFALPRVQGLKGQG